MDRLSLLKNKLILRYLELNQIGLTRFVYKLYDKVKTLTNIFFLESRIKNIFKKKTVYFNIVSNNLSFDDVKIKLGKLKNSSEILYYANNYVRNNFFDNNEFEFINEKLIEKDYSGKGFKCPLVHDYSTNKNLRLLWDKVRSHHLLTLYVAFLITKNKKYYKVLNEHIDILLKRENFLKNYLWGDALNLSIRSLNVLSLLQILDTNDKILKKKLIELYIINCEGIAIIRSNYSSIINNHHFCETLALSLYYNLINNKKKLKVEIKYINHCYNKIFYKNGCNYEGSLPYQRFILEFLLVTQYFFLNYSKKFQFKVSFQIVIENIWNYSKNVTGKNQQFKQFGDLDYGQVIKLNVNNYFRLNELRLLYNYTKMKDLSKISLFDLYNKVSSKSVLNNIKKFIAFPGYSRVKLDNNIEIWIDMDYPGLGKNGVGGHGHNDVTSIILDFFNEEIICDHGVSSYFVNKQKRNFERSSFNHNVVNRVGFEQNELLGRYYINSNIEILNVIDKSSRKVTSLELMYKISYKDGINLKCKRIINYKNKVLKITDIIFSKNIVNLEQNWNFNKEKFISLQRKSIRFKRCKISFSNNICNKKIHYENLNHYKIAKKQLRIKVPLRSYKLKDGFRYSAELKLNTK